MILRFIAPCDEVTCGDHAYCKADGHEAYCICEDGWTFNPNDIAAGCVGKCFEMLLKMINISAFLWIINNI